MQVINESGMTFGLLEQQGGASVAVVKGVFRLVQGGVCAPMREQEPLRGDQTYMDEIGRSPSWPTDQAPFKPYFDLVVLGHFHQPGGVALPSGRGSLRFGPLFKELAFFGKRVATMAADGSWSIEGPEPMAAVPLRWEFSFGGLSDPRNPMGRGREPIDLPGGGQVLHLPWIENPDEPTRPLHRPQPDNFAPVPMSFGERQRKQGTRDRRWAVFRAPLPPLDVDPSVHNMAPEGQQAGNYPRGGETLELVNLHPAEPILTTRMPGVLPRVGVLRGKDRDVEMTMVPMVLDTIVVQPDLDRVVLVWRGQVAAGPVQAVRVDQVALEAAADGGGFEQAMRESYLAALGPDEAAVQAEIDLAFATLRDQVGALELDPAAKAAILSATDPAAAFEGIVGEIDRLLADLERRRAS